MKFSDALRDYLDAYSDWRAVRGSRYAEGPAFAILTARAVDLDAVAGQLSGPFAPTKPSKPRRSPK